MNYTKKQIAEIRKEYNRKGWSFRSETFMINDEIPIELISKAYSVSFIKILSELEDEIIRIEHSQLKEIQYKFHKSVKNIASRKDKKGLSKEINLSLFALKNKYANNPKVEDIEHYDKYIEVSCISQTDPDLRINFRIHPENTDPQFSYDLSIRHYREFFE